MHAENDSKKPTEDDLKKLKEKVTKLFIQADGKYNANLISFLRYYIKDNYTVYDTISDTYVKVLSKVLRGEVIDNLESYVMVALKLNAITRQKIVALFITNNTNGEVYPCLKTAYDREIYERIDDVAQVIKEKFEMIRENFSKGERYLFYALLDGKNNDQIAEEMNLSVKTVYRKRVELKSKIKDDLNFLCS